MQLEQLVLIIAVGSGLCLLLLMHYLLQSFVYQNYSWVPYVHRLLHARIKITPC